MVSKVLWPAVIIPILTLTPGFTAAAYETFGAPAGMEMAAPAPHVQYPTVHQGE